ncbi:aspartyl-phosphate phosphatase Spo0E family protein [Halobacillus salinarum]|uniref:Aspartyl-phosphate phosphatase Spo0E family protein n=1 Tax=Halobacillus salinarum TaxID=2932257 RepID=A0ABY4EI84_9BACI|nr:aspartyl-phosphate phosphatase Spo0E family protein [Halobacillus salinarum]UOQ43334.1 aspartyl-phosphate phosphatase Spo0E family protein [Halobacillus salinarum]
MVNKCSLHRQIEDLREKMYEVYETSADYEDLLKISQELDRLLNELEKMKNN